MKCSNALDSFAQCQSIMDKGRSGKEIYAVGVIRLWQIHGCSRFFSLFLQNRFTLSYFEHFISFKQQCSLRVMNGWLRRVSKFVERDGWRGEMRALVLWFSKIRDVFSWILQFHCPKVHKQTCFIHTQNYCFCAVREGGRQGVAGQRRAFCSHFAFGKHSTTRLQQRLQKSWDSLLKGAEHWGTAARSAGMKPMHVQHGPNCVTGWIPGLSAYSDDFEKEKVQPQKDSPPTPKQQHF